MNNSNSFTHSEFSHKVEQLKGKAKSLLEPALLLYVLLLDGDTPIWCKTLCCGALAYLINPFDVMPDTLPIGLLDDLAVMTAAVSKVANHIQPHHRELANDLF